MKINRLMQALYVSGCVCVAVPAFASATQGLPSSSVEASQPSSPQCGDEGDEDDDDKDEDEGETRLCGGDTDDDDGDEDEGEGEETRAPAF